MADFIEKQLSKLTVIAAARMQEGRFEEEVRLRERILRIACTAFEEGDFALFPYLLDLAECYRRRLKFDHAEVLYEKIFALLKHADETPRIQLFLAICYSKAGGCYAAHGKLESAASAFKNAIVWGTKVYGKTGPLVANFIDDYLMIIEKIKSIEEAEPTNMDVSVVASPKFSFLSS